MSPSGNAHVMAEVRENLRQLVNGVTEKRLQPLALSEATPPQPTCPSRRKKKRRKGKGPEETPTVYLRACSLRFASLPAAFREEPLLTQKPAGISTAAQLPSPAASVFQGGHLDTQTDLKQYLLDYKPTIDSVPQARILLIGQLKAGKSSFFNSINSIFRSNITSQAKVGEMTTSLTLKYRTYQVKAGRGGPPLAFLLCDTMGLEAREDGGMNIEDIDSILKGYIKEGYPVRAVYLTKPQKQLLYEFRKLNLIN
nr:uncharacterized protein LOC111846178 [Paramormyrops kingsleyae]